MAGGRIIAMDINDARLALADELGADELTGVGGYYGIGGAGPGYADG